MRWLGRFRHKPASSTLPRDEQQPVAPSEPSSDSSESSKLEDEEIAEALNPLFQAASWDDTYAYLRQHSEILLREAAVQYLDAVMAARNAGGQYEQVIEIGRYRALLADARTRGVEAAKARTNDDDAWQLHSRDLNATRG